MKKDTRIDYVTKEIARLEALGVNPDGYYEGCRQALIVGLKEDLAQIKKEKR